MRNWENRSTEVANLLNPAFLMILCHQCIRGYNSISKEHPDYALPFIAISLVLHKVTRESLPRSIRTRFSTWITRIQGAYAKIGYAKRAESLVPYVKDAIAYGLLNGSLSIKGGYLIANGPQIRYPSSSSDIISSEVIDCYNKAYFCGRWIAGTGKMETVFALLGVTP